MRLSQLEYVREVVSLGSVSKAAIKLHISQPSISIAIQELEDELGVKLFIRSKKLLIPTDEGREFAIKASEILDSFSKLETETKNSGNKSGIIKIGMSPMVSNIMFNGHLSEYISENPETKFSTYEYGVQEIIDALRDGVIDIAVTYAGVSHPSIEIIPIDTVKLAFFIKNTDPLASHKTIHVEDIQNHPLAFLKTNAYRLTGEYILDRFLRKGIEPNIIVSSNQLSVIEHCILYDGLGAFVHDKCFCDVESKGIACIPVEPPRIQDIVILRRKDIHERKEVTKFANYMRKFACNINSPE